MSDLLSNRFVNLAVTIPLSNSNPSVGRGLDGDEGADDGGGLTVAGPLEGGAGGGSRSNGGGGGAGRGDQEGEELRADLQLVVQGLLRLGEMEKVLGTVQERVSEDLKLIIRWRFLIF